MAILCVSYDLRQPGRNYDQLYSALNTRGAKRVLESVWVLDTSLTPQITPMALGNALRLAMDSNDGLFVATIVDPTNWWNIDGATHGWLGTKM